MDYNLNNMNIVTDEAPEALAADSCDRPDPIVRCDEIAACAGQIDRTAVESMVSCLSDADPMVRWEASLALAKSAQCLQRPEDLGQVLTMGSSNAITLSELLDAMREGLAAPDAAQRASFAEALGRWPHPTAVTLLEKSLTDDNADVRAAAARGLGQLGALESTDELIAALADTSLWVRRAAADALGAIGDRRATAPLVEMARQGPALTRTAALAALGRLPGKEARETLRASLGDPQGEVRWQAARSLEASGTSASLPALEGVLNDSFTLFERSVGDVALSAIQAIGQREQGMWHALRAAVIRLIGRYRRRP